uniref:AlNc14C164G7848 protein n=1 Tax=Albugo laibachii Nc14 TaxID=890382 RepID=F0WN16_9STRA|nr:AlNc14C164G7848 [Albugo laibachii Nc14]|eukprot:CCA22703.1 AlNc14C164G7848 [Albugo laibachii Nc14]
MFIKFSTRSIVVVAVAISTIPVTNGRSEYVTKLPFDKCINPPENSDQLKLFGHTEGNDEENTDFGTAFKDAEYKWTDDLCKQTQLSSLDSTYKGKTNGEILCDPCCELENAPKGVAKLGEGTCSKSSGRNPAEQNENGKNGTVKPSPSPSASPNTGAPSTGSPNTKTPTTGTPKSNSPYTPPPSPPSPYSPAGNESKCKAKVRRRLSATQD